MQMILVYWRDIPSQVIVKRGRERGKALLSERFQEAIDRAAMRAGKGGSDAYMSEWRRDNSRIDAEGTLEELARAEADRLEAEYPQDRVKELVANFGFHEHPNKK